MSNFTLDRRDFVKLGAIAGAGLVIGIRLPVANARSRRAAAPLRTGASASARVTVGASASSAAGPPPHAASARHIANGKSHLPTSVSGRGAAALASHGSIVAPAH